MLEFERMIQRIKSQYGKRKLRNSKTGEWLVPLPGELRSMFNGALDGEKLNRSGKWCSIAFWESVKKCLDSIFTTYEKVKSDERPLIIVRQDAVGSSSF